MVILLYCLLSILMTWPLITSLQTALPSQRHGDQWAHQWTFWWVKEAITNNQNPFFTDLLFHPEGVSLATHNIAWFNILLWIPLQAIVGDIVATNLIYIGIFAANGFAMFLLIRELTGSFPAAFIGGLIFAYWPYTLSQAGHPNMIVVFWLPLALLFLLRTLENGRLLDAIITGALLALGGIARWQLLIVGGFLFGMYLIYRCLTDAPCRNRRTAGLLIVTGVVAIALMAPLALPVVTNQLASPEPDEALLPVGRSAFASAYIIPNQTLTLWGELVSRLPENFNFAHDQMEFIGILAIALAIYGALREWRSARFWTFMVLVYVLLALGPELKIGHRPYPEVPMPYRLVEDLFFVEIQRAPHRFNAFLGLPIAMLAALGIVRLLSKRSTRIKTVVTIGLVVFILAEYLMVPYPIEDAWTPEWYYQLAEEPGNFAILDLPMNDRDEDKWYMQYQTMHGKALVEGHVSRPPDDAFDFIDNSPFLKSLSRHNVMDTDIADVSRQMNALSDADVRYINLHKRFADRERLAAWQDWLTFEPIYEDEEMVVFRTDPVLGRDFTLEHAMGDHIGLIHVDYEPKSVMQGAQLHVTARWGSAGKPENDYQACVAVTDSTSHWITSQCQTLPEYLPTTDWRANEIVRGDAALQIDPFMEPGTYSVTLSLVEANSYDVVHKALSLGDLEIVPWPRIYDLPATLEPLEANWGDSIHLPGYNLDVSADVLRLTLYWQAVRRIPSSYKVFVHLIDQATGEVAGQSDAVPRDWSYPTNLWDRGEVIEDIITLPLDHLPPGEYRLQVGLYDPETGERLGVYSVVGKDYADDAVPLGIVRR